MVADDGEAQVHDAATALPQTGPERSACSTEYPQGVHALPPVPALQVATAYRAPAAPPASALKTAIQRPALAAPSLG